jgi:hypothetical protein
MKSRPVEGLFQHPQAITLIDLGNGVLSDIGDFSPIDRGIRQRIGQALAN